MLFLSAKGFIYDTVPGTLTGCCHGDTWRYRDTSVVMVAENNAMAT